MDFEVMYRAMESRDRRFDGRFFNAVSSTGIYCRPICPAPTPRRPNTRFFRHAAAAEAAGYRPCRRCRPEVSPDSPEWDTRADLVGRGLQLIADGFVDRSGVRALAAHVGVTERHLQRVFNQEVGTTPGVIARSRRARLARQLLTETAVPITDVAFAAGFASIRTFNETMRRIYQVTPSDLRRGQSAAPGVLQLQLNYRGPLPVENLLDRLREFAIPGVEAIEGGSYRRAARFGKGHALLELTPGDGFVFLSVESDAIAPLAPIVQRARRLMDLDADPATIHDHLKRFGKLEDLVDSTPGMRQVGAFEPFETAVGIVLCRGSTAASARTTAGRIATRLGTAIQTSSPSIARLFPTPGELSGADLTELGLGHRRARTVNALARAVHDGDVVLDGSADPVTVRHQLLEIQGIGPHTAELVAWRALRDPDAFPLRSRDLRRGDLDPDAWRPWRGYASTYLSAAMGGTAAGQMTPVGHELGSGLGLRLLTRARVRPG